MRRFCSRGPKGDQGNRPFCCTSGGPDGDKLKVSFCNTLPTGMTMFVGRDMRNVRPRRTTTNEFRRGSMASG